MQLFRRLRERKQLATETTLIANSGLFDTDWYLAQYPDVAKAGVNSLTHYLSSGAADGRDPNPLFDTDWYLAQNSDVAQAHINPLVHYLNQGAAEGRDPNLLFDSDWYLAQNPDVAQAHINPLVHYLNKGAAEGRDPSPLFDTDWYLAQKPDVAQVHINPLVHYLNRGAAEGRDPNPLFDTDWYFAQYPDVAAAGLNPLLHYLQYGAAGGRDPNPLFYTDWYLAQYPDVAKAGVNPLTDYLSSGAADGRDPNPLFDTDWYLAQYPDVAKAGVNPLTDYLSSGVAEGRDPNPLFDTDWYLAQYPDVAAAGLNPLLHYLRYGAAGGRDPNPLFDTDWYLAQYPDVAKTGVNPLIHFITIGRKEGRKSLPDSAVRKNAAKDVAVEAFDELSGIDPEFAATISPTIIGALPTIIGYPPDPRHLAWRELFHSLHQIYERMIFVPSLGIGGADMIAINALRAAHEKYGVNNTLLVVTDQSAVQASDRLPDGSHIRVLSELSPQLTPQDRAQIVTTLIYALRPQAVLNVDSEALWEATADRGVALASVTKLYAALSCSDFASDGRRIGCADRYLRRCLPYLTKIYSDNASYAKQLITAYGVPEALQERFTVLYQPVQMLRTTLNCHVTGGESHFRILWAGTLNHQRNPALVADIAKLCPTLHFDIYGDGEEKYISKLKKRSPSNVNYKGTYTAFDYIPVERYNAFLYTSLWDGLPNVLLEAAARAIPVVASNVGGIGELVDSETGWVVENYREPFGYVEALEQLRNNPDEATRRVAKIQSQIRRRHSWQHYLQSFSEPPSFLD